ncbi:dienelactone hydrolase family protein [Rhizobium rhizogenes]|uniref:dienelactone hydrolase family protein n=1 Tax=Rhizobium rhizogenes TaxID=359 RepID=UPI001573C42A|nr:dienelactone hydrolase family protein [Rhizobium rhizogenes]NTF83976.1 dienelactone hydrolase family protein [Rhizobium rhizogenes]
MEGAPILIPVNDGEMGGYIVKPAQPNGGAVIVLQEIFGVNATIRGFADSFAAAGYLAVAPDLFWRQERDVQIGPGEAGGYERALALMKNFDQTLALDDIAAVIDWLDRRPDAIGKVGVVGFCVGGKLAFQLAGRAHVECTVSYYGTGIHTVLSAAAGFFGKVLLHVAEADHLCPPEAQKAIAEAFADNSNVVVMSYPDAGHAFARIGGDHYNAAAASRANMATFEFLQENLQASVR